MPVEPSTKRTVAFFDGQNLYHAAKEAFGYHYPNYDPVALAREVCGPQGWTLTEVRFYTGVPAPEDDRHWHEFWSRKLAVLGTRNVYTFKRRLRYQNRTVRLPDGQEHSYLVGHEKGIDVRIALDVVRLAHERAYDVGLIFSQDQDLSEVAEEVRLIARRESLWLKLASAFPVSPTTSNRRGIDKTDWVQIDRATYDHCRDPNDYRPN